FNGNNQIAYDLYKKNIENKQKILIKNDDNNSLCRAENVTFGIENTTFDLICDNQNYGQVTITLHGSYSVENVLMAVSVAYKLGLSKEEILEGIKNIKPTDHRLYTYKTDNNITIIDDSFNANEYGTKMALEYLSLFKEQRKIVVTPGLVDLGKMEKEKNYDFGKQISQVADLCFIVNLNARDDLKNGMLENGFNQENIILCDTLEDAKTKFSEILKSGDVVLMCNDLPDNYI
ncbi:MAG: UDP-N-acetylmuramoyl-tripeptide--D-alanyl-D-alanine ligase, partial [Clostridia bacterium]|nr:UDP-N-acetylmuramoyl-tripeptide--D-alanyl-D-alanine ligase [Clostridia bacterium]